MYTTAVLQGTLSEVIKESYSQHVRTLWSCLACSADSDLQALLAYPWTHTTSDAPGSLHILCPLPAIFPSLQRPRPATRAQPGARPAARTHLQGSPFPQPFGVPASRLSRQRAVVPSRPAGSLAPPGLGPAAHRERGGRRPGPESPAHLVDDAGSVVCRCSRV